MPEITIERLGAIFDVCGTPEVTRQTNVRLHEAREAEIAATGSSRRPSGEYLTGRLVVRCAIPAYLEAFHLAFGGKLSARQWICTTYEHGLAAADALLPHVLVQREALLTWRDLRATIKRDGPMRIGPDAHSVRELRLLRLRQLRAERKDVHLEDLEAVVVPLRLLAEDAAAMARQVMRNREAAAMNAQMRAAPIESIQDHLGQTIWTRASGEPLPEAFR